jgi:tRNA (guanosine-2'-O-)-methyltransferase
MEHEEREALIAYLEDFARPQRLEKLKSILEKRTRYISVLLEDLYQPHNTAAVLRSCDAFGIQDVHVLQIENRYQPSKTVSVGAEKWVYQHPYQGDESLTVNKIREFQEQGWKMVATCPNDEGFTPQNLPLDQPIMLMFGSEKPGLSQAAIDHADFKLQIPMYGFSESFNVSVSVALILQVISSRVREGSTPWSLQEQEKREIYLDWLRKSVRRATELEQRFYTDRP